MHNNSSAKQQLMQLIRGNWVSQSIYAVAKLQIADFLQSGPRPVGELAKKTGCHSGALYRLLRALASLGVFEMLEGQRFALTPISDCLCSDAEYSARDSSIMMSEIFYQPWSNILLSLQTGKPAFDEVYGQPLFEHLAVDQSHARIFDAAMISWMNEESAAVVDALQWPKQAKVVDVGGGAGGLIRTVIEKQPQLDGVVFDLPEVIARNQDLYGSDDSYRGCQFESGDFFYAVPIAADIYLLRNIIHDWNDKDSISILKNCRKACKDSSKVFLLEYLIPEDNRPFSGTWLDVMMLVGPGGQERTLQEYQQLLAVSGLQLTAVIPTATDMSIIEAVPA
jgi:hypothetical protein